MTEYSNHFQHLRQQLVSQIERQGVRDSVVLEAMLRVPRESFLAPELAEFAYQDSPLPIGNQQTISQPFIVALMTSALQLEPTDRVLEVGTGSGYAAAILANIAAQVYTVDRYQQLAKTARLRLHALGFKNVHVMRGDGSRGWQKYAPYDAIIVAAGGPEVPQPLLDQLRVGGRLVMPVGEDRTLQKLIRIRKLDDEHIEREELADVRFVPLVGASGWNDEDRTAEWKALKWFPSWIWRNCKVLEFDD